MKRSVRNHNLVVATSCFSGIFKSIQLAAVYCLYYNMDFTKQKVKNYNSILTRHNTEANNQEISVWEIEMDILKSVDFDCEKEAFQFPFRAKMKMAGKKIKPKDMAVAIQNINDALEVYLILSVYTLKKNYRFSNDQVKEWWDHVKDFCLLYAQGMHDEHVIEYFKQECDLVITE